MLDVLNVLRSVVQETLSMSQYKIKQRKRNKTSVCFVRHWEYNPTVPPQCIVYFTVLYTIMLYIFNRSSSFCSFKFTAGNLFTCRPKYKNCRSVVSNTYNILGSWVFIQINDHLAGCKDAQTCLFQSMRHVYVLFLVSEKGLIPLIETSLQPA